MPTDGHQSDEHQRGPHQPDSGQRKLEEAEVFGQKPARGAGDDRERRHQKQRFGDKAGDHLAARASGSPQDRPTINPMNRSMPVHITPHMTCTKIRKPAIVACDGSDHDNECEAGISEIVPTNDAAWVRRP